MNFITEIWSNLAADEKAFLADDAKAMAIRWDYVGAEGKAAIERQFTEMLNTQRGAVQFVTDQTQVVETAFDGLEVRTKARALTIWDQAKIAYAHGWPFWGPLVMAAGFAGHWL